MSVPYQLQMIFREVFEDAGLVIAAETSSENLPQWDSVATIRIVLAVEGEFGIRFTTDQVAALKSVADIIRVLPAEA